MADGADDDGLDRGLIFLGLNADIERQFEFIQRVWLNGSRFENLTDDKDPICGDNDGSGEFTIQRKPFHLRLDGLPRFVTTRAGGYFFLPGLRALASIAALESTA